MNEYEQKVLDRWKLVLDAGDPCHDRLNAALTLEKIQTKLSEIIKSRTDHLAKTMGSVVIPCVRYMLTYDVEIEFDPDFRSEHNTTIIPTVENEQTMFGMSIQAEMLSVLCGQAKDSKKVKMGLVTQENIGDDMIKTYFNIEFYKQEDLNDE